MLLVLGGGDTLIVSGCSDTNFQMDRDNFRSQSVWVFTLNGEVVTWKSSKQDTMADSTCESEYITTICNTPIHVFHCPYLSNFILEKRPFRTMGVHVVHLEYMKDVHQVAEAHMLGI